MRKFVIISVILLLIGGSAFGYSLYHYMEVTGFSFNFPTAATSDSSKPTDAATKDEAATEQASEKTNGEGVFAANMAKAEKAVADMSNEEMVGQLIMAVCPDLETAKTDIPHYNLGGMLIQNENLDYMSFDEVKAAVAELKEKGGTKPVIAAQEEGGNVTTVSGHDAFYEYNFDSPRNTYDAGGMDAVKESEDKKAQMLSDLGFNLNLAPVLDLPEDISQVMFSRSLSNDASLVSQYAVYTTETSQKKNVSVCLKHFPGYGTIPDSYDEVITDTREASEIEGTDLTPFKAGVNAGAHFVMVSNVVVANLDSNHTAALSATIHSKLRSDVGFSGVILTDVLDDADYSAYSDSKPTSVAAILAGNDMILVKDYKTAFSELSAAVSDGTISKDTLTDSCTRILAYKYTAGILG